MSSGDKDILKHLGKRVAEIAQDPVQTRKVDDWKALNGLNPNRPMFMIDQIPWHEMNVNGELTCHCEDEFYRELEWDLRRRIYRWEHMPADFVVHPTIEVPKVSRDTGFGINADRDVAVLDDASDVVGQHFNDQIKTEEDIDKITPPRVEFDREATDERVARAREIFDGILEVRPQGQFPHYAMWDILAMWRSPDAILYDLIDRPDFLHAICERLTEAHLTWLERLKEECLLGHDQDTIHCTGAYTDELPAAGFDPEQPRPEDNWTFGMSQIFSTVSPEMHEEFERPYLSQWFERFGLVYYGCCEPLDNKMDLVRKLPNIRKVSMSPWVDQEKGARAIGGDFVFSRKPNPARLTGDNWNPEAVEKDLRETLTVCRHHGCPCELILKDISTVNYEPERLWKWNDIARELVTEYAE